MIKRFYQLIIVLVVIALFAMGGRYGTRQIVHPGNLILRWGSGSGDTDEARMDASTHSMQTISHDHHEIHAGNAFTVAATTVCDTTTVKWQITTPDSTRYTHLVFTLTSTGEATFLVTEGSDRDDGTVLSEVNRRRVGTPTAATVIVTASPTGGSTDGATILFTMRNGITSIAGRNIEGSSARATNEWVLKPNTKYVVSVTTYAAVYVTMILDWYEHTDRD
jgi:hypothetical protein